MMDEKAQQFLKRAANKVREGGLEIIQDGWPILSSILKDLEPVVEALLEASSLVGDTPNGTEKKIPQESETDRQIKRELLE